MLRRCFEFAALLTALAARAAAQPANAQYDEAKVPAYTLPDPLRFEDGRTVSTPDAWRERRAEILRLFETHVYGRSPAPVAAMRFVVAETARDAFAGLATRRQVRGLLDGSERAPPFELLACGRDAA